MGYFVMVMAVILPLALASGAGAACNVCHSKNPKMASMHKELGYKDCFKCHGPTSKRTAKDKETEMSTDNLCAGCHNKEGEAEAAKR